MPSDRKAEFKVGDRVMTRTAFGHGHGATGAGTVKVVYGDVAYGIEFDSKRGETHFWYVDYEIMRAPNGARGRAGSGH